MKKITTIILLIVMSIMLVSCGNETKKAKELVTDFSENLKWGNIEEIGEVYDIQYLIDIYNNSEERTTDAVIVNILYSHLNDISFVVHDVIENDNGTYSVNVDYTYVYATDIINATRDECISSTQSRYNSEEFSELFTEIYAQNESTMEKRMSTNSVTFTVEKNDGNLVISNVSNLFYDVLTAGTGERFTIYGE